MFSNGRFKRTYRAPCWLLALVTFQAFFRPEITDCHMAHPNVRPYVFTLLLELALTFERLERFATSYRDLIVDKVMQGIAPPRPDRIWEETTRRAMMPPGTAPASAAPTSWEGISWLSNGPQPT